MATKLVSVQQAAQSALAAWITSQIAADLPDLDVEPRWPDPDKTLEKEVVTLVRIGKMKRELTEPVPVSRVDNSGAGTTLVTWRVAFCEQPMQLDVWATDSFTLDDIIARLEPILHAGLQSIGQTNVDPVENELLLALGDGWSGWAGFVFDEPEIDDGPDAVAVSEYRATMRGSATFNLTVDATSPLLARAAIKERLRESALADQSVASLSSVTQTGSGPTVTVSGTPVVNAAMVIKIIVGGAVGVATYQISSNGGGSYGSTLTTTASAALNDTGITASFAAGTYVANTTYAFTATAEPYGAATVASDGTTTFNLT